MSKSLRLSEKWFRRGLWLVAFVFAWFLVGLGSTVVGDLPRWSRRHQLEDFMDPQQRTAVNAQILGARQASKERRTRWSKRSLRLQTAQADNRAARETFSNWLATRRVTERAEQDQALLERTRELDGLRKAEREAQGAVEAQQQAALNARQAREPWRGRACASWRSAASVALREAQRAQELRVFLYRLALTLPLLVAAGWLFAKKRKGTYWPFVWGFIFFALFAFFVELVPYLPSYGGLRALPGGHRAHGGGRALRDPGFAALPGAPEAGRGVARYPAPKRHELRPGADAAEQKRVPGLRARRST